MCTPPPSESTPSIPEPIVGPPTPMPSPPSPAAGAAAAPSRSDAGFVTFGAPAAPAPPSDALRAARRRGRGAAVEAERPRRPSRSPAARTERRLRDLRRAAAAAPADRRTSAVPSRPRSGAARRASEPTPSRRPTRRRREPGRGRRRPRRPPRRRRPRSRRRRPRRCGRSSPTRPRRGRRPGRAARGRAAARGREPAPVAEEPEEPGEESGGKGVLIGIGVAVVLAAIVGFLVGGVRRRARPRAAARRRAARLQRRARGALPRGLDQGDGAPQIPGMTRSPVADEPPAAKGGRASCSARSSRARTTRRCCRSASSPRSASTPARRPPREAVQLDRGELQAYRYKTLRPNGLDEAVTLFAVPPPRAIATVACVAPGTDVRGDRELAEAQRGQGVPGRPEQGLPDALEQDAGRLDKKVSSGAQRAPAREHPEGAGLRGGRSRLRLQGRVGGDLEARGLAGRRARRTRRSPPRCKLTGAAYGAPQPPGRRQQGRLQRRPRRRSSARAGGRDALEGSSGGLQDRRMTDG